VLAKKRLDQILAYERGERMSRKHSMPKPKDRAAIYILFAALSNLVTLLVALAIMAWFDWRLALAVALFLPLVPLPFALLRPRMRAAMTRFRDANGRYLGFVQEALSAVLPVQIGEHTVGFLSDVRAIFTFIGDLSYSLYLSVRHPQLVRWRDMLYYMDRTGSDAVPIVVMICFLMGLILGFQAAVQMHQFGADIYVADLVGLSIVMELGPLMVAMICTGRAGSSFAAEIGSMKVAEEVDALVTMGLDPNRFLVLPKVLALTAAMPLLTLFGDIAGIAGGFAVGMGQLGLPFVAYYSRTAQVISLWHIGQGLIKSVVFALLVSAVGCQRGLRAEGGAQGVGESTTSSVVSGIFLIVLADAVLTIVFNALG